MTPAVPLPAPLLGVHDLTLRIGGKLILDRVSLTLGQGGTLGLVGESGCGKSMTALSIMGLLPERAAATGAIRLDETDLLGLDDAALCRLRGRRMAMIFQEPMTALDPVMTIGAQIAEPMRQHLGLSSSEIAPRVRSMLDRVGLPGPRFGANLYPHQLSGGQRQRIMIAMALALEPDLLIADEPTTALDVTVQLEILRLIQGIVRDSRMALLLITHDLGVVAAMCARMAVMYAGRIVEAGATADVLRAPAHPYTRGLLDALPRTHARDEPLAVIQGSVPRDLEAIQGCAFAERCAHASERCRSERPPLAPLAGPPAGRHPVACHHPLAAP